MGRDGVRVLPMFLAGPLPLRPVNRSLGSLDWWGLLTLTWLPPCRRTSGRCDRASPPCADRPSYGRSIMQGGCLDLDMLAFGIWCGLLAVTFLLNLGFLRHDFTLWSVAILWRHCGRMYFSRLLAARCYCYHHQHPRPIYHHLFYVRYPLSCLLLHVIPAVCPPFRICWIQPSGKRLVCTWSGHPLSWPLARLGPSAMQASVCLAPWRRRALCAVPGCLPDGHFGCSVRCLAYVAMSSCCLIPARNGGVYACGWPGGEVWLVHASPLPSDRCLCTIPGGVFCSICGLYSLAGLCNLARLGSGLHPVPDGRSGFCPWTSGKDAW
jgi:hypothetical protein